MLCGIVDIGANTIRLSIYDCDEKTEAVRRLLHKKSMAGLASYIEAKRMSPQGVDLACSVLESYQEILYNFGINQLYVFATAPFRNIKNTQEVVEEILLRTGITVQVLTGQEEAILGFIGATHDAQLRKGIVLDIGGGSTELTVYDGKQVLAASSIPIGSLNLYKTYVKKLLPSKRECREILHRSMLEVQNLKGLKEAKGYKIICGIGGTIRATAALNNMVFELPAGNREIDGDNVEKMLELYSSAPKYFISKVLQAVPDRSHTIIPGMIILNSVITIFGCDTILMSSYGVREGYLFDRVLQQSGGQ